jgi:hypothetical protein
MGNKYKAFEAFEKSIIIVSILTPVSRESAISWQTVIT